MNFNTEKKIIIAGHRGNPKDFPENTIASFKSSIEMHVDMIETDIHTTKDGELVLMHDHDVKRTSDSEGLIKNFTFDDIRKTNVGTATEKMTVPTLKELFELVSPIQDLCVNLEFKVYLNDEGAERVHYTVDKTIEMCKQFDMKDRIIFSSFDAYILEYINKNYKNEFLIQGYYPYTHMFNVKEQPESYLDYACYWGNAVENCEYLISKGIVPCTGSNTSEEDFILQVKNGCRMFTENDPRAAIMWKNKLLCK